MIVFKIRILFIVDCGGGGVLVVGLFSLSFHPSIQIASNLPPKIVPTVLGTTIQLAINVPILRMLAMGNSVAIHAKNTSNNIFLIVRFSSRCRCDCCASVEAADVVS
jgi:hypothetical protein